jgi:aminopeptidase-like protein
MGRHVGIINIQNTFDLKRHEIKSGIQNYDVIMPNEISCITFNNNSLNSSRRYVTAKHYSILHRVVERLSQHNLKTSHLRHV